MSDLPTFENTLGDWAADAACRGVDPDVAYCCDGCRRKQKSQNSARARAVARRSVA